MIIIIIIIIIIIVIATTMSWIRTKVSFAILRTALVCLRGTRSRQGRRANVQENDLEIDLNI